MNFELALTDRIFLFKIIRFFSVVLSLTIFLLLNKTRYSKIKNLMLFLVYMSLCFLSSKFTSVLENVLLTKQDFLDLLSTNGGDRVSGPVFICLLIYTNNLKNIKLTNTIFLAALPALALGKLGCFILGDTCFGIQTNSLFGIVVAGVNPSYFKVHPVPLYDATFYIFSFFLFYFVKKKKYLNIQNYLIILAISIYGFLIEFIRTNQSVLIGATINQFFYGITIIATFLILLYLYTRRDFNFNS